MGTICSKDPEIQNTNLRPISHSRMTKSTTIKKEATIKDEITIHISNKSIGSRSMQRAATPDTKVSQTVAMSSTPSVKRNKQFFGSKKDSKTSDGIFSEVEGAGLKIIKKHNRNYEDQCLIEKCLMKHFFMRSLDRQARSEIIKEMSLCYINKNAIIFKQGSIGVYFYIIKNGVVELSRNETVVKKLSIGDNFGELALLHGSPRSVTVKAVTDCFMWVLERKNFKKIIEHITQSQFEENKKFIQTTPILSCLESNEKTILSSNLYRVSFEPGEYIVKEGEQADCLYIIKEGEVECSKNGNVIRIMKEGEYFGERGILIDSNRTIDVIAKTKTVCYSVSITTFKLMLGENFREMLYLNFIKYAFARSERFQNFNTHLLDGKVFKLFTPENLPNNTIAFEKGYDTSSKLVVIVDGSLSYENDTSVIVAKRGSILFEEDLLYDRHNHIENNLVASPDVLFVEANTKDILEIFGNSFLNMINMSNIVQSLRKVSLFKVISPKKLTEIGQKIKIQSFNKGEKVITQGEEGTKFYIVKKGKIDIYIGKDQYVRTIGRNDFLGERALLISEPRSATAIATESVEVFYLEKEDFLLSIEENMKLYLINRLFLQDSSIQLNDLDYIGNLGKGNYGTVSLVQSSKNQFYYAIKTISKKKVLSEQLQTNLQLEKSILLQIDHPFIVKLVKTLKDGYNIYFLMEYVKGKELFDVIRDIGLLNRKQTQFFGGSMMLAIDYLHENNCVFRDIKPENVILCDTGYIKLIDFGTAKQIKERTSTVIGTPHYMAPEIILGEGYSFQVDFWSIAVCMYEFMCGIVPFGENAEDPMEVYLAIINEQLTFPDYCKDKKFRNLITQMLNKNPLSRISKLSQVKIHPWFCDFDWEGLLSLNLTPEVFPKLKESLYFENLEGKKDNFCNYIKTFVTSTELITGNENELIVKDSSEWFKNF